MNPRQASPFIACLTGMLAIAPIASSTRAAETGGYGFAAAAQEISQLFWLAETAATCGWASRDEALKFQRFSVRFVSAHLSEVNVKALVNLVSAEGYERSVRRVAEEGSPENCSIPRWQTGWLAYKAAAQAHEEEF
jgi:hypothetical protein